MHARRICSSDETLLKEVEYLRNVLKHNGYPRHIVERKVENLYAKRMRREE